MQRTHAGPVKEEALDNTVVEALRDMGARAQVKVLILSRLDVVPQSHRPISTGHVAAFADATRFPAG